MGWPVCDTPANRRLRGRAQGLWPPDMVTLYRLDFVSGKAFWWPGDRALTHPIPMPLLTPSPD